MSSKLEEYLNNCSKTISNDQDLIAFLQSIIDAEESKPYEIRDYELIDEATETLLELGSIDIEQLEKNANCISQKLYSRILDSESRNKTKRTKMKWIIPIAAILSALIIGSVIAYAFGFDILSMSRKQYQSLAEDTWHNDENKSLIITQNHSEFSSYEEIATISEFKGILYCEVIPDNYYLTSIEVTKYDQQISVEAYYDSDSGSIYFLTELNTACSFDGREPVKIGFLDVFFTEYDDIVQVEWTYNNCYYVLQVKDEKIAIDFINHLKEI